MPHDFVRLRIKRADGADMFVSRDRFDHEGDLVGVDHLGPAGEWVEVGENANFETVWRKHYGAYESDVVVGSFEDRAGPRMVPAP